MTSLFLTSGSAESAYSQGIHGNYHADLDASSLKSTDDKSANKSFQVAHLPVKGYLVIGQDSTSGRIHTLAMLRRLQLENPEPLPKSTLTLGIRRLVEPLRDYAIYLFKHAERPELTSP